MKLAFVGAGKMATALGRGLVERGVIPARDLIAADVAPAAAAAFTQATGIACRARAAEIVTDADVILLAVKPQVAAGVAAEIAAASRGKLLISIAAGIRLATLARWFAGERIVRAMPNTPLMVGMGASVLSSGAAVTAADREFARGIFAALGEVHELPEAAMDAVTALSGSGPAYVFEFVQGLADAGAHAGLDAATALALTVQTVRGAAEMLKRGLGTPEELRTAVTSPGGTTAAGLAVLEQAQFRRLLAGTVAAAKARSVELGRAQA